MRILSRYIFTQIWTPLIACLGAFLFLWIVYDMFDNFSDFVEAHAPASMVADFYFQQVPRAIAIGLPIAVLLGALYCLLTLSRNSEFTAMQACGVSIFDIGAPFLLVGMITAVVLTWLNWEWSPQAVRNRELILDKFKSLRETVERKRDETESKRTVNARSVVYRSKDSRRLWFIHRAELGDNMLLRNVEILQLDEQGQDLWKYYVREMSWLGRGWKMNGVLRISYDRQGNASGKQFFETHRDDSLTETFTQVTSTVQAPDVMSVPEIFAHLRDNADHSAERLAPFRTYLFYRVTIGLSCIATVLIALPFALTTSRRDLFAGFGKAVLFYFAYLTVTHFLLALGKGARIPPLMAGAGPALAFIVLGGTLFWLRATARQVPSLRSMFRSSPPRPTPPSAPPPQAASPA
jgi:lipopolysaccharide export system permease protein